MGMQLVALNFQSPDESLLLNQSLFEVNGGVKCGYVLKPEYQHGDRSVNVQNKKIIKIEVIAGMQLPQKPSDAKDIVDPYVVLSLVTPNQSPEYQGQTHTTKHVDNNGFNPLWKESCQFKYLEDEINFLVIKVWDKDQKDVMLCWNAFPINYIRRGIRCVELKGLKLQPVASKLLVKIDIVD